MSNEKVSVIVPIYKVEKYLDRCVQSIRNQTYRNLEIILVDDGSPDNCPQMCDTYAKQDDRIRVIHKENGGVSDARNVGVRNAKGKFIAFVDPDDKIHSQMIESLYVAIESVNAQIAICNYVWCNDQQQYHDKIYQKDLIAEKTYEVSFAETQRIYFEEPNRRNLYIVVWNKLYHRSVFEHIQFPNGKIHEDEYVMSKILHDANKIVQIDISLYYYYTFHGNSIMGEFKKSRFDLFNSYLEKIKCYFEWEYDDFAQRMIFHAVHMLAQYKEWSCEVQCDMTDSIEHYRRELCSIIKRNKSRLQFNKRQKIENFLFQINFKIYYFFWKVTRKLK